ncbi:lipopolysaccharide core biosynthesis protein [Pseudomonas sp. CAU 1711]|uniref:lipopolysaccharide core biosynthesis protein n=1 Tax=Pseudomonas sp. CAU 1711 TaxID=3140356 RepID=UPI003261A9C2
MTAAEHLLAAKSFAELRGSYSGALFIIASGPSTKAFPLQRYADYPMLALNGSICCLAEAGIAPLFYLCDDSSFVRNRLPLLLQALAHAQHLALSPRVVGSLLAQEPQALDGRSAYRFERVNRLPEGGEAMSDRRFARQARKDPDFECDFSWFRQKPNRIGFSRNLDKGYFSSRTIPYAGIQLAYHLGFSRVFLVGVDLDSSLGRFYEQGEQAVKSRLDGDYEDYILPCFRLMAERVINPGFQVYNLSANSRLPAEVVPKIDLDQLDALLAAS